MSQERSITINRPTVLADIDVGGAKVAVSVVDRTVPTA
jgi:hypothetical protein